MNKIKNKKIFINIYILKQILHFFLILITFFSFNFNSYAHELWLEPRNFNFVENQATEIDINIGQNFFGTPFGFSNKDKKKLFLEKKNNLLEIEQRNGNFPAIQLIQLENRFTILNYETNFEYLKYENYESFKNFLNEYNLQNILQDFDDQNIPTENYKRFAKTLLYNDEKSFFIQKPKLDFEIIALNFPKKDEVLNLKLFHKKKPLSNWPILIFSKDNDQTYNEKIETNSNGEFEIYLNEDRTYLFSAVKVFKPNFLDKFKLKSDLVSLWASLTVKAN